MTRAIVTSTLMPPMMNRRALVMGAALLGAGSAAMARQPAPVAKPVLHDALDRMIPVQVGGWSYRDQSGIVLPPSDSLSDWLYSGLVTRNYISTDRLQIMLLVAYSNVQDGMLQLHRPEVCYPAGGYQLTPTRAEKISNGLGGTIAANAFSADGINRTEQILYWTRIGNRFPTGWLDQRVAVLRSNLEGIIPDGILVRISALAPDMASAQADLKNFAAQLIKDVSPAGRRLLLAQA